jgi:hypothetical protein
MAENKPVNRTAIVLALLGVMVVSILVYVFSLGGDQSAGSGDSTPEAPPPFEKPASEVLVANVGSNAVVGYAIDGSTGLVADVTTPSRVIGGSLNPGSWVGIRSPFGVTVDSGGKIFVSNQGDAASPPSVTLFPADADGPTPNYDIHTGPAAQLSKPQGIVLRRNPRALLVSNWIDPPVAGQFSGVLEFSTQSGMNAPTGQIAGVATTISTPMGVALDASTNVYVVDAASDRVLIFQPQPGTRSNGAPIGVISGDQTMLDRPAHVAIDGLGNVYVSNLRSNKSKPGYVTIFPPNSNGNVAPVRVLGVPGASLGTTQLRQPIGVAVHARGTLFVTQDDELLVFASSASGNDAPLQRIQHPGLNYATAVSVRDP